MSSHEHLWPDVAEWFAERSVVDDAVEVAIEETGDDATDDTPDAAVAEDVETTDADVAGTDLQELDGIGPAYASRLEAAGIGTVETLADAEPAVVAADTDIDEGRIRGWIDAAGGRTS